jgi:hypothetical protein
MANCKACGVELVWLKHERTKKPMPIEAAPHVEGNIVVNLGNKTYRIANDKEYEGHKISDTGPKLHVSHFARCPEADGFRKKDRV